MDRRDFLKTSGAAAVATGTAGSAALAFEEPAAPAIASGVRWLTLASFVPTASATAGLGPERLVHRIETATGGRYAIEVTGEGAVANLAYGPVGRHAMLHPALVVFAGLPFAQGLDAPSHHAWLAVGGGQMLWDEMAAGYGFKPLLAGHTGASAGVWSTARLESASDFKGLAIHASRLAATVLAALGADVVQVPAAELKAQLADGRVRAAEWLGPLAAVSPDLQPLSQRLYEPGFHRAGVALALDVRTSAWERMGAHDRAVIEACAAQEYQLALAEARAHSLVAVQASVPAKWPVRLSFSDPVADALDQTMADVLDDLARADAESQRILASYHAFRAMLGDDLVV